MAANADLLSTLSRLQNSGASVVDAMSAIEKAGFVIVPKEPTEEMKQAYCDIWDGATYGDAAQGYKAMIEAEEQTSEKRDD